MWTKFDDGFPTLRLRRNIVFEYIYHYTLNSWRDIVEHGLGDIAVSHHPLGVPMSKRKFPWEHCLQRLVEFIPVR